MLQVTNFVCSVASDKFLCAIAVENFCMHYDAITEYSMLQQVRLTPMHKLRVCVVQGSIVNTGGLFSV